MKRKHKHNLWKKRMEAYEASGETIQEWVSKHDDITEYQFHYWRKKIKAEVNSDLCDEVNHTWTSFDVPTFTTTSIEVRLDDLSVYIPENVSEEHLSRVLRVLRNG
jgi:HSP20 family molecular chaperone IbpA